MKTVLYILGAITTGITMIIPLVILLVLGLAVFAALRNIRNSSEKIVSSNTPRGELVVMRGGLLVPEGKGPVDVICRMMFGLAFAETNDDE